MNADWFGFLWLLAYIAAWELTGYVYRHFIRKTKRVEIPRGKQVASLHDLRYGPLKDCPVCSTRRHRTS